MLVLTLQYVSLVYCQMSRGGGSSASRGGGFGGMFGGMTQSRANVVSKELISTKFK